MATTSLPKNRPARLRMVRILQEAEERYRNELMDAEERLMLHDRIVRLKIRLPRMLRAIVAGLLFCGPAIVLVAIWPSA